MSSLYNRPEINRKNIKLLFRKGTIFRQEMSWKRREEREKKRERERKTARIIQISSVYWKPGEITVRIEFLCY